MSAMTDRPTDPQDAFGGCLVKVALYLVLFGLVTLFLLGLFAGWALAGGFM